MKNLNILLIIALSLISATKVIAQGMKPKIMVVPDRNWMDRHGFLKTEDVQGEKVYVPDYNTAFVKNSDVKNVLSSISEEMSKENFDLILLERKLEELTRQAARNEVRSNRRTGSAVAQSSYDALMKAANVDIILELWWELESVGGNRAVHFRVTGVDAWSQKQIANSEGWGEPGSASPVSRLLGEQVHNNMQPFIQGLERYFTRMQTNNSREISFELYMLDEAFDNGLEDGLNTRFGGETLKRIIRAWLNKEAHGFTTDYETDDEIIYSQLRMPFYDKDNMPMNAGDFIYGLQEVLLKQYKIDSDSRTIGLGKVILDIIGIR